MRNRGTWGLAFAGGLGGLVTWLVSEPYAHTAQEHGVKAGMTLFTLGSFYGWFAHLMLGALIAGFLAFAMSAARSSLGRALLAGLGAALIGGPLTCGIDAFSDYLGIQFSKGPDGGLAAGLLVPMMWHLAVSLTIAFSVALASHPTRQRLKSAFMAGLGAAIASYFARDMLSVFSAAKTVASIDFSKVDPKNPEAMLASLDVWVPWAVDRLAYEVMMGLVIGLALGFAESVARAAWVRHEAGRNEGRDFGLYGGPNRVGSAEGIEVSVRGDQNVAPVHAVIQPHQGHWMISDVSGMGLTVNGFLTPVAYLNDGDAFQIGQSVLRFRMDGRKRVPTYTGAVETRPYAAPAQAAPSPSPVVAPVAVTIEHRLVDPFGNVHTLPEGPSIVGRSADAQIRLEFDKMVSRQHALLTPVGDGLLVRPLGAKNGTFVNGQEIAADTVIKPGDQIKVGTTTLTYRI